MATISFEVKVNELFLEEELQSIRVVIFDPVCPKYRDMERVKVSEVCDDGHQTSLYSEIDCNEDVLNFSVDLLQIQINTEEAHFFGEYDFGKNKSLKELHGSKVKIDNLEKEVFEEFEYNDDEEEEGEYHYWR